MSRLSVPQALRFGASPIASLPPKPTSEPPIPPSHRPSGSFPALRLTETKEYVLVSAIVPGFVESDLDVTLSNDILCITGRHRAQVPAGFSVLRRGRRSADFRSEIKLLNEVAWADTEARLEHGILTIRLRKDAPASRPTIPIRLT